LAFSAENGYKLTTGDVTADERLAAQSALVDAAAESYRLSDALFQKGIDSFLQVLDSQRSRYTAQQAPISLHLARLANLVTRYKVLDGGVLENTSDGQMPSSRP